MRDVGSLAEPHGVQLSLPVRDPQADGAQHLSDAVLVERAEPLAQELVQGELVHRADDGSLQILGRSDGDQERFRTRRVLNQTHAVQAFYAVGCAPHEAELLPMVGLAEERVLPLLPVLWTVQVRLDQLFMVIPLREVSEDLRRRLVYSDSCKGGLEETGLPSGADGVGLGHHQSMRLQVLVVPVTSADIFIEPVGLDRHPKLRRCGVSPPWDEAVLRQHRLPVICGQCVWTAVTRLITVRPSSKFRRQTHQSVGLHTAAVCHRRVGQLVHASDVPHDENGVGGEQRCMLIPLAAEGRFGAVERDILLALLRVDQAAVVLGVERST